MARTSKKAIPGSTPANGRGGCFVVQRGDGLFWDGKAWVEDWADAMQFTGADDPWARADELLTELSRSGKVCGLGVAYVPRAPGPGRDRFR